ncbi:helix-turn-helix transcriptional regulator [Micromonospora parathelypteridis]|uniref:Putative DNA-binding transcriptional regulator YafY n=1 Tax=Micromonospora parathelypteridis TaxID=1839617 RepID=A0A840VWB7_9ACTN|nr:YafY family protein [Micromonospora parathelypteridis]MBB5480917.1 putative DNA-binding transcriptional regulator YafY [Micromonospora parathelypteridis]GGO20991.1 transcriptional regulator [Micromonospora parathelypteridis]
MSNTPARLLRLLSLLQTPREWPGSELAERLGVTPRTVRRDVDRLRELGYPVHASLGAQGGYRLVAGKAMPPLLLDDEEAVAIAVGLQSAARQPVAGIAEASLRALAKLQQVLPPRLGRHVGTLGAATVSSPAPAVSLVDPMQLVVLAAAASAHERVRFDYRDGDGAVSQRLVEPHRLVVVGRRWYVVAYDNERTDWRMFRVERIENARTIGVRVPPRELPADDASAFVTNQLYSLAPVFRAVATLALPAEQAAVRLGDHAGELEPLDDTSCRWRSPEDTIDWLAFRLALLGCDFTVHEPPELVEHLRRLGRRITRAVAPGTS